MLKEKVRLTEAQETLLITLFAKARGCPDNFFVDETAQRVLDQIDYDFGQLNVPTGTSLTVCLRAKKLDDYARAFLEQHPLATILHLGCGLDGRFQRIDNGQVEWYDLDLPDVIELRRKFFAETNRTHLIASSATDLTWLDAVPQQGQPVLIIAEGLFMYLAEADVKRLFLALQTAFPGCHLAFDAYSKLTTHRVQSHPSLKKTGAAIQWGIDDPQTIETWGDGIRFQEEWFFIQSPEIIKLAFRYRLIFKIAGLFPIANKAHRILYFTL
ncbi:MAG: class I SAM-dependent methyltransferase [Ardenticatenaceae bacterium]|nr:class I SAM-dependent methyltransferase [Ardenticatenaceae bacterium]MCB9445485.1 class I SAM-dependent methyltransferase [Ardenticatenaceae bacterium]